MERGQFFVAIVGKGKKGDLPQGWSGALNGKVLEAHSAVCGKMEDYVAPPATIVVEKVSVTVGAGTYAAKLLKRAAPAMRQMGVDVGLDEANAAAVFTGAGEAAHVIFLPVLVIGLADRTWKKVKESDHPLTWFDTKQAAGLVYGAQQGDKAAVATLAWADAIVGKVVEAQQAEIAAKAKEIAAKAKAERDAAKAAAPKVPEVAPKAKKTKAAKAANAGEPGKSGAPITASLAPKSMGK